MSWILLIFPFKTNVRSRYLFSHRVELNSTEDEGSVLEWIWGELLGHGGPPRFGQLTKEEQNERKKKKDRHNVLYSG